ncbi:hypothetical protein DBR17_14505 [Sphingomonas sp. HMWF008]|nr:hypothetical protein DBR17_14505 [Sphingomonas sp. HMWF008]
MNGNGFDALYLALMLILPVSALAARRLPLGQTVKMALAWVVIFAVMFLLVTLWQDVFAAGAPIASGS